MDDSGRKAALVIGAGDATGGAIARRFAREGYVACVTRRSADKLAPPVDIPQNSTNALRRSGIAFSSARR